MKKADLFDNNLSQSNYPINSQTLQDAYIAKFDDLLGRIPESKATVWDEHLMDSVSLIASASLFKEKNTKEFFKLTKNHVPKVESTCVIFFVRPLLHVLDNVGEFLQYCCDDIQSKKLLIYFIPNQTVSCMEKLKDLGIANKFTTIDILPFYIYPLSWNVFSMEQPNCFREFYVDHDITMVMNIVNSLKVVESLYGRAQVFKGIGPYSNRVINILKSDRAHHQQQHENHKTSKMINEVIMIDRNVDLITMLMTQMTYGGMIDEIFDINCGVTNVPIPKAASNADENELSKSLTSVPNSLKDGDIKPQKIQLFSPNPTNNTTKVYAQLGALNYSQVGGVLSVSTKALSNEVEENKKSQSVLEMKQFVNKLPYLNALKHQISIHTTIAELINKRIDKNDFREIISIEEEFVESFNLDKVHPLIEKKISLMEPYENVLKLICLQSIMSGGLKPRTYEYYSTAITHSYGYQKITLLMKLGLAGLLTVRSSAAASSLTNISTTNNVYQYLINCLKLTQREYLSFTDTDDDKVSFYKCFHGYQPLSVKIIQYLLNPTLPEFRTKQFNEILKLLPGPINMPKTPDIHTTGRNSNVLNQGLSKNFLVFFIGGCSMSEISALEYLFKNECPGYNVLIGCTALYNTSSFFQNIETCSGTKSPI